MCGGGLSLGLTPAGAKNPKRRQSLSLGEQESDWGEARFYRKDPSRGV